MNGVKPINNSIQQDKLDSAQFFLCHMHGTDSSSTEAKIISHAHGRSEGSINRVAILAVEAKVFFINHNYF